MSITKITERNWFHSPLVRTPVRADKVNEVIDNVNSILAGNTYQGVLDCSANPNYPAATENYYWTVSVAGKVGGASGDDVEVGDVITCITTNLGGTKAAVGADFVITQKNMVPTTVAVLRTGTNNTDFVSAKTLKDQGITTAAATIMALAGGTTEQLLLTTTAAQKGLTVSSTLQTGHIIDITSTVADAALNICNVTATKSAAFTTAKTLAAYNSSLTQLTGDVNNSNYIGFASTNVGASGSKASTYGFYSIASGTFDAAANTQVVGGFAFVPTCTLNGTNVDVYGINLDFTGMTNASSSDVYGVRVVAKTGVDAAYYGLLGAQGRGINIDANATPRTNSDSLIYEAASLTTTSSNVNDLAITFTTGQTAGTEVVSGFNVGITGLAANANGAVATCYTGRVAAVSTERQDYAGFIANVASVRDTADTDNGYIVGFTGTMSDAGASAYGLRVTTGGYPGVATAFTHTDGQWYGAYINHDVACAAANTAVGVALYMDMADANNTKRAITTERNITGALTANAAYGRFANVLSQVGNNSSATDFNLSDVADTTGVQNIIFSHTTTATSAGPGVLTAADVFAGTALRIDVTGLTNDANTKLDVSAKAFDIAYTITETAGLNTLQTGTDVSRIVFTMTTNPHVEAGSANILHITGTDGSALPVYAGGFALSAGNIDMATFDITDANLSLYGVNIAMPVTNASASAIYALHASAGTTNTVDLLYGPSGNAHVGINIDMTEPTSIAGRFISDTTVANAMQNIVTSRDINGTVVGAVALTGFANTLGQAVNHTGGDFIVTQTATTAGILNLILEHTTNIGAATSAPDVFSSTAMLINVAATVAGDASADLDVAARALDVSYTLTETLGIIRLATTDVARMALTVPAGITSAGAYTLNMLNLDGSAYLGDDANTTLRGINIHLGTSTAAAELTGIYTQGVCSTAINVNNAGIAAASRGILVNMATPLADYGDGYAMSEYNLNLTASSTAGHVAALGAWINATGVCTIGAGGTYVAAQQNGVYGDATAVMTGAKVIFGMRAQYQGDDQPLLLAAHSIHSPGKPITAIFEVSSWHNDTGYEVGTGATGACTGYLRIMTDTNGSYKYVRLYDVTT